LLEEEGVGAMAWEEPELDSEDERVISMYDGIRKILSGQGETTEPRNRTEQRTTEPRKRTVKGKPRIKRDVSTSRDVIHTLQCGRILKVDVEPRLVVITVEKVDGERRQLRIEARVE
jgi:hypothetical protein